ncbi:MAG: UDP-N-acetylglucosamine 2-epimerase (non-hydrolyzing) [Candidatus Lokiarchaeota archaeon]|nr:UDP-N-acetylglucosamine 2-epimerase (non-hydrolyzing) [Candidatus Lokiarchaeota archaeon]
MKKVLTIFGTRPEAIKLAPVALELKKYSDKIESLVCVTAQHRLMLDQVLRLFGLVPDFDLNLMQPDQTLFDLTSDAIRSIQKIIEKVRPDIILVQGDTTTAFVSGLAAFYSKTILGHVEAGLRTGEKYSPFPEEINRKLIAVLADYHFAPTQRNKSNLLAENYPEEKIFVTGNTVIDALQIIAEKERPLTGFGLDKININKKIILITAHRRETFGVYLQDICHALIDIAKTRSDCEIVFPVHLNPNIRQPIKKYLDKVPHIHLLEPITYDLFVSLMKKSYIILTDSGGIQEEAPALGIPVLVLREATERSEAIKAGTIKLVGRKREVIIDEINLLLDNKIHYKKFARAINPYGDGKAASRIVNHVFKILNLSK